MRLTPDQKLEDILKEVKKIANKNPDIQKILATELSFPPSNKDTTREGKVMQSLIDILCFFAENHSLFKGYDVPYNEIRNSISTRNSEKYYTIVDEVYSILFKQSKK